MPELCILTILPNCVNIALKVEGRADRISVLWLLMRTFGWRYVFILVTFSVWLASLSLLPFLTESLFEWLAEGQVMHVTAAASRCLPDGCSPADPDFYRQQRRGRTGMVCNSRGKSRPQPGCSWNEQGWPFVCTLRLPRELQCSLPVVSADHLPGL